MKKYVLSTTDEMKAFIQANAKTTLKDLYLDSKRRNMQEQEFKDYCYNDLKNYMNLQATWAYSKPMQLFKEYLESSPGRISLANKNLTKLYFSQNRFKITALPTNEYHYLRDDFKKDKFLVISTVSN